MPQGNNLVLEVWKQGDTLGMSVFEQDASASTLRYYHQHQVYFSDITRLCQEISEILSDSSRKHKPDTRQLERLKKAGQFLWDHLLARKVKERLSSAGPVSLLLLLDEELIFIPWELLYDGKEFLCLKFNVGRLLRTRLDIETRNFRSLAPVLRMLILANPTNDLPQAYSEGIEIKNGFSRLTDKVRIDFKSSAIDRLYVRKNLRDYDIVHYAGHCEHDNDGLSVPGWRLRDGCLSLEDIAEMGQTGEMPAIIFSNACFSAGDYQFTNYSLASAFLFSGVRHYIGSVKELNDKAARAFARIFYAFLIKGRTVGEAMRLARIKLVKDHGLVSFFWAGYLLYGDPAFSIFTRPRQAKHSIVVKKPGIRINIHRLRYFAPIFISIPLLFMAHAYLPTASPAAYINFSRAEKLFQQGDNKKVIELCSDVIRMDPVYLAVYPVIADTYRRMGKDKEALRYYFDYMLYSQKRNDLKNLVLAYTKIGWFYHGQGEYLKAFDFYQKAIALSLQNKDKLGEAIALRKLAVWYIDRRQDDLALGLLMKSSEINRERENSASHRYQLACDYFDIGLVFINKDDLAAANDFYNKSFQLFKRLKLKYELSDNYFNLGEIHLFNKEYHKALDCYRKGLAIDEVQGNVPALASDYSMIGELYMEMDDLKAAQENLEKSLEICKRFKLPQEEANACYDMGRLYAREKKKNLAREYYRRAQEIYYSVDPYYYQEIKAALRELDGAQQ